MAVFDGNNFLAKATAVPQGTAADIFVPIPSGGKYVIFRKVITTRPSATLASSTAAVGVYTAASAGGTAIVTGATGTTTGLTATGSYTDCTIVPTVALLLTQQTSGTNVGLTGVFVSVAGTPNVTATCDIYFEGDILG
jgi:hypothetical protein